MLRRLLERWRRPPSEAEVAEELQVHLAMEEQQRIEAGETPDAARAAARREFGNVLMVQEVTREMWGWSRFEQLGMDIRHGFRLLRLNPVFALVAGLSLALGVGANTTFFQLITEVHFRSLPVPRPWELAEVRINGGNGGMGLNSSKFGGIPGPMWQEAQREQKAFTGLFAWQLMNVRTGEGSSTRQARGLQVSGDFFPVLQIMPWRGRLFSPEDDAVSCPNARAVISYNYWRDQFGERSPGLDSRLVINGMPHEVIGVTPPGFTGLAVGEAFDVVIPVCRPNGPVRRDVFAWTVMGRLNSGWTIDKASAHLGALSPAIMAATEIQGYGPEVTARYRGFRLAALPAYNGVSQLRQRYDSALWMLLGIAGLVLLIACTNLANLMLARSSAREREIALRLSLGATRGRLLRQFTVESGLLALFGAVLGVGIAQLLGRLLVALMSTQRDAIHLTFTLDWRVLGFSAAVASAACVIFGTLPAIQVTGMDPERVLRGGGRGSTSGGRQFQTQRLMVSLQIGVSLVLLVAAFLFTASFANLIRLDAGMRQEGITVLFAGMPRPMPPGQVEAFQRRLLELVEAVPGVRSAASTTIVPLLGSSWSHGVDVGGEKGDARFAWVSPHYFRTMDIAVTAGREFGETDTRSSARVAIVNQAFVRKYCGDSAPLGQKVRTVAEPGFPSTVLEIVGVVRDTRYSGLRVLATPAVFAPALQYPQLGPWASLMIHRETVHPAAVAAIKTALAREYPEMVLDFQDFRGMVQDGLVRERVLAMLSGFFGFLATILATVGLYGVVSCMVSRKTSEIGVRVALGARRSQIAGMVMRESVRLLGVGAVAGAAAALLITRSAGSLLFGLEAHDPKVLAGAVTLLAGVTLLASLIPARKAANVSPLTALRYD